MTGVTSPRRYSVARTFWIGYLGVNGKLTAESNAMTEESPLLVIEQPTTLTATPEEMDAIISTLPKAEDHLIAKALSGVSASAGGEWHLLWDIFSLRLKAGDKDDPFPSIRSWVNQEIAVPDDLTEKQLQFLGAFMQCEAPEVRARVGDILWLKAKDYKAAQAAVAAYIESGSILEDIAHWPASFARYERAIRLAAKLGKKTPLLDNALRHLDERVRHHDGNDPLYFTSRSLELLYEFDYGEALELAAIAEKVAYAAADAKDFHRARSYYKVAAKLSAEGGGTDKAASLLLADAASYEAEAEVREAGGDHLAAQHFWQHAYTAYKKLQVSPQKLDEVHQRLNAAGARSVENMQRFSSEAIDCSSEVEKAQNHISNKPIGDALYRFAHMVPLLNEETLTKETIENHKGALHVYFESSTMSRDGRVVHIRPSLMSDDPKEQKRALESLVEGHAHFYRTLTARVYLNQGHARFIDQHHAHTAYLSRLLRKSSFIPPQRHELFYRGFKAFFAGDFVLALHLLTPQVENALRHLLWNAGIIPHTVDVSGVEEKWSLSQILEKDKSHAKLSELLGEDMLFELRGLMHFKGGPNLRNEALHGISEIEDMLGEHAYYLLWIFLRLCLTKIDKEEFAQPDTWRNRLKSKVYWWAFLLRRFCSRCAHRMRHGRRRLTTMIPTGADAIERVKA